MVLWASFWWYFHEPEPSARIEAPGSEEVPELGRVLVDWRLKIKPEGLLRRPNQLARLERMGLITSEHPYSGEQDRPETHEDMFISQSSFWQLDPRVYLFTITTTAPSESGVSGRSQSAELDTSPNPSASLDYLGRGFPFGAGPNTQGTYLPTYYPPPPLQFTTTNGIRHPIRQQPPRQGEVVYSRYIPSMGQYLTYRVAVKDKPKPGNTAWMIPEPQNRPYPNMCLGPDCTDDVKNLSEWMNDPQTTTELVRRGPESVQERFLEERLCRANTYPLIGCLGNQSFGYFEAYWVMEDPFGRLLDSPDLYDRALRFLIARKNFRHRDRVKIWVSSLVHHCFLSDMRTQRVLTYVRADNHKFTSLLEEIGFFKDCEVNLPHKRAVVMKIERGAWTSPGV